jgi:chromate reductase
MKILTLSGSTRSNSLNLRLLEGIALFFPQQEFIFYKKLDQLPLFRAEDDKYPWAESVLEWIATSGELVGKRILPITFTPHEPRGEKAMQSLCWSLQALDAQIIVQLPLFQNEIDFNDDTTLVENDSVEMLIEGIKLLIGVN